MCLCSIYGVGVSVRALLVENNASHWWFSTLSQFFGCHHFWLRLTFFLDVIQPTEYIRCSCFFFVVCGISVVSSHVSLYSSIWYIYPIEKPIYTYPHGIFEICCIRPWIFTCHMKIKMQLARAVARCLFHFFYRFERIISVTKERKREMKITTILLSTVFDISHRRNFKHTH